MPTKLFNPPRVEDVKASIEACLANADRLMEDALQLEFQEEGGTRLAISVLAQEEYAKAFLLYMVRDGLVPWDSDVWRIIRDHACKHLLAIVIDYISPEWETVEECKAIIKAEFDRDGAFPPHVSSALNILYFEKIRGGNFWNDEERYEPSVKDIARGERDRQKQNALYVCIDRSCRASSTPVKRITREAAKAEYEQARRYGRIVCNVLESQEYESLQLRKFREATRQVFWQKYRPIHFPDGTSTEVG